MSDNDKQTAFNDLAALWLAGEADNATTAQLLEICKSDPARLTELADLASVDRLLPLLEEPGILFSEEVRKRLEGNADDHAAFTNAVSKRIQPEKKPIPFLPLLVAAAAAVAIVFLLPRNNGQGQPAKLSPIASVSQTVAATWANNMAPTDNGLSRGEYHLTGGLVSMKFESGVTMVVEAPAQFQIESEERVVLIDGTVTANVPDGAEGFTIDTQSTRIIDRGTEFAVSASPTGETEVHVLQGIVDTHPINDNSTMQRLIENQAVAIDAHGTTPEFIDAAPGRFYRNLPTMTQDYKWLHWSFNENEGLVAAAEDHGLGNGLTEAVMATIDKNGPMPKWIPGPAGSAVSFSGKGDYFKTDYMGISGTGARTVAFWVRVPEDWTPKNGYGMLGWGSYRYKGATWQISANPAIKEGPIGHLRIGTNQAQVIGSTDLRDGKWHHVAVVMYGGEGADTSTHVIAFIDGKIDSAETKSVHAINTDSSEDLPMLIGRNASRNTKGIRCFKGDLDELYIFDAALSQEEIQDLMHNTLDKGTGTQRQ